MLFTISTTHTPATELGYLLAKNPTRVQKFELSYGHAHVFYPVASEQLCTVALLLDIDPIGLVRGRPQGDIGTIAEYVNDRPYVASSFLSVAIAQVFGSALGGRCRERPELADAPIPLDATIESLPCRGGERFLRLLFEPLGYTIDANRLPLDDRFPEWGESPYFRVRLQGVVRLRDLLAHLYVLIPVLDDDKHYWVGDDEVNKLLSKGEGWLSDHPAKDQIALRYLKHRRHLARAALDRLVSEEVHDIAEQDEERAKNEDAVEEKLSLNDQRIDLVVAALKVQGAHSVIDLGCGEGRLLRALLRDKSFERIAGVDVSLRALEFAKLRLRVDQLPPKQQARLSFFQAALTYRDQRFFGYDAATLIEVIEHIDYTRLSALERVVFEYANPRCIFITTPNAEYNVKFENLAAGKFRHGDHRFEWTRSEFETWATRVATQFGYNVEFAPIGPVDETLGAPTQMAIFVLRGIGGDS